MEALQYWSAGWLHGDREGHRRAFTGGTLDCEDATDALGSLAHGAQAQVAGKVTGRVEALAVVADLELEGARIAGKGELDAGGAGVFYGVVE